MNRMLLTLARVVLAIVALPRRAYSWLSRRVLFARLAAVGPGTTVDTLTSLVLTPQTIRLGSNVFINWGALLSGEITIGSNVLIGPRVSILSGNHLFAIRGKSIRHLRLRQDNPEEVLALLIEDEVWIGAGATLLGGVTIGVGAVVGAASVVTKDVPPFTVAVGNPCRPVRQIFDDQTLVEHLCQLGYEDVYARQVVERRRAGLAHAELPVIDNSERVQRYYYRGSLQQPVPVRATHSIP